MNPKIIKIDEHTWSIDEMGYHCGDMTLGLLVFWDIENN